jgi:SAM-dependent methyltransferase
MALTAADHYNEAFFAAREAGVLESARIVVPLVNRFVRPASVVDVGCGRGTWLRAFAETGAHRLTGLDGDYVARDKLAIPPASFVPTDLARLTHIDGEFDLAICIEVLEHLPPVAGHNVVAALTRAAPAVLFSAAVPGQGGTGHINEQWPRYWREIFSRHGFTMLDPLRRQIRDDPRVKFWYRQNLLMFASADALARNPILAEEAARAPEQEIEWLHISLVVKDRSPIEVFKETARRVLSTRMKKRLKVMLSPASRTELQRKSSYE